VIKRAVIVRNAAVLLGAQPVTWSLTLVFMVVVPRSVGAAEWGEWAIGWAVSLIARAALDFGINTVLLKEVAKDRSRAQEYVGAAVAAKLILAAPMLAAVLGFSYIAGYSAHTRLILGIIAVTTAVSFVATPTVLALQALEKMHVNAIGSILTSAVVTVVAVLLVKFFAAGMVSITLVNFGAIVVGHALQWVWLGRSVRIRPIFRWTLMRTLLVDGLPYWASTVFLTVYVFVDGVLISIFCSPREVGWYGVASQIIATLGFLPYAVTTAVFPALTHNFRNDRGEMALLAGRSFRFLMTVGIPASVGLGLVANSLVLSIYSVPFAPAAPVLTLLALTLLPVFAATLVNGFLIATDRQVQWTWVMAGLCVVNPIINVFTIRYFHATQGNGALGAAVALLATDIATGAAAIWLLPAELRGAARSAIPAMLRSAGATALMAAVVWPLRYQFVPVPVLAGLATFLAAALALRVFPADEVAILMAVPRRLLSRRRADADRRGPSEQSVPVELAG
jgi:O-antigen/teichoic acid export membrane protein